MKRLLYLTLALMLALALCACGGDIKISEGLKFSLNDDAQSYCVSGIGTCTDTDIVIPSAHDGLPVTSIGYKAFYECSSLTSIVIPDSVTSIGEEAFSYCSSLTSIVIPDGVTSIGDGAFCWCSNLTSITVADGNPAYHSEGNCLIETASKTLIAGCSTSVIPTDGSVTSIGDGAFYDCRSLTSIVIPDSVTSVGDGAFYDCSSLTSITFTGTKAQWNAISKGFDWNINTGAYTIHCTDGDISK